MGRYGSPVLLAHPDREAAAELPALEDLFRAAARWTRARLVNRAGSDIPVRLGVAQVSTVGQILDDPDTRDGGVFAMFRFDPPGLPGLMIVQGRLLARLVGVLLGEDPDTEPPPYRVRQVTEVERRIARRVCDDMALGIQATWPAEAPVRLDIDSLGTSPRLASGLAQTTPVVAASFDFGRPHDPFGLLIVAVPAQVTRDLRVQKVDPLARGERERSMRLARVMPVELEVVAELAHVRMPLGEVRQLAPGSLIDLGSRRNVRLKVNGRTAFVGLPGESHGSHSVRVVAQCGDPEGA